MKASSQKRRVKSTVTVQWTEKAKEAGLHIPGISIGHVNKLLEIQSEPLPVVQKVRGVKNLPSPSAKVSIGPHITNGFLRLEPELGVYKVTWKGDYYIKQLREAGLI
jgi:hypothetical protein